MLFIKQNNLSEHTTRPYCACCLVPNFAKNISGKIATLNLGKSDHNLDVLKYKPVLGVQLIKVMRFLSVTSCSNCLISVAKSLLMHLKLSK